MSRRGRFAQGALARGDEFGRGLGNVHQVAVEEQHIGNGCADDRVLGGHVLQRFCWADEAGGLIECKRHQAHIPACQKCWKLCISALAVIVNVLALGQLCRVNFDHRTHQAKVPMRAGLRHLIEQGNVQPLVNHPIKAQPRPAQAGQIRMGVGGVFTLGKVLNIHCAGKTMNPAVLQAFGLIQAWTPCEHQVSNFEQSVLPLA